MLNPDFTGVILNSGQCEERFTSRKIIAKHKQSHHSNQCHLCAECDNTFVFRSNLWSHEKIVHNAKYARRFVNRMAFKWWSILLTEWDQGCVPFCFFFLFFFINSGIHSVWSCIMVWKGMQEQDIVSKLFIPKNTAVKLDTVQIDELIMTKETQLKFWRTKNQIVSRTQLGTEQYFFVTFAANILSTEKILSFTFKGTYVGSNKNCLHSRKALHNIGYLKEHARTHAWPIYLRTLSLVAH